MKSEAESQAVFAVSYVRNVRGRAILLDSTAELSIKIFYNRKASCTMVGPQKKPQIETLILQTTSIILNMVCYIIELDNCI